MGDRTISQVCEDCLDHPELLRGCNLFVQAVCAAFDYGDVFSKGDDADAMVKKFSSAPFHLIGKDKAKATEYANSGKLVIGGLNRAGMSYTSKQHKEIKASMGHVVIIAPGGPSKPGKTVLLDGTEQDSAGGYPFTYGGAAILKYRIKSMLSVDIVFPKPVRDDVAYAYLDIPKPPSK